MRLRKIRTMRDVWNELAVRKSTGARGFGGAGAERLGLAGGIVRIQSGWDPRAAGNARLEGDPAVRKQGVHPWVFADFKTQEHTGRVLYNHKGSFTRDRQPKSVAFMIKEKWSKEKRESILKW